MHYIYVSGSSKLNTNRYSDFNAVKKIKTSVKNKLKTRLTRHMFECRKNIYHQDQVKKCRLPIILKLDIKTEINNSNPLAYQVKVNCFLKAIGSTVAEIRLKK